MVNIQSIQVELLVWGCIFCFIAAVCMFLSNNYDAEKRKWLFWMEISTSMLLGNDALAYIYRGYPGQVGSILVHVTNFLVFVASDIVMLFFHAYVCCYVLPKDRKKSPFREKLVYILCLIGVLLVIISQFTDFYYYFDVNNYYHRNEGFAISMLIPVVSMIVDLSLLIQYHKNVSRKIFLSLFSYIALPIIAAAIQASLYGLSLINIAICISMIIMFVAATSEFNEEMYNVLKKKAEVEDRLEIATTLNRFVAQLSSDTDADTAINNLLAVINDYFDGDRSYIFNMDEENNIITNTHEHVKDGMKAYKNELQNLPATVISTWMKNFENNNVYYIEDVESEKGTGVYEIIKTHGVKSMLEMPLIKEHRIVGFLGIDNPKEHYNDSTLLPSIQYFVTNSLAMKKQQEYLQYLSYRDMLTGLYNRNKYMDMISENSSRSFDNTGVVYIDLNGLKQINDGEGHDAGDRLIRNAAAAIMTEFPDEAYRIGGDEFVIISEDTPKEEFYSRVERIEKEMSKHGVSASVGVLWNEHNGSISKMLKNADSRMYDEKERFHGN